MQAPYWILVGAVVLASFDRLICRSYLKKYKKADQFLLVYQLGSAVMMLPLVLLAAIGKSPSQALWESEQAQLSHLTVFLILGLFSWLGFGLCTFRAAERVEVSVQSVIGKTKLIWTSLIGIFAFSEIPTIAQVLGIFFIAAATINITALMKAQQKSDRTGLIYALGSAVFLSAAYAIDKWLVRFILPEVVVFLGFAGCACLAFLLNRKRRLGELLDVSRAALAASFFGASSYYFVVMSLQNLPLMVVIPVLQANFIIDMIFGYVFLRERDHLYGRIVTALVAMIGVLLVI